MSLGPRALGPTPWHCPGAKVVYQVAAPLLHYCLLAFCKLGALTQYVQQGLDGRSAVSAGGAGHLPKQVFLLGCPRVLHTDTQDVQEQLTWQA